MTWNFCIPQAVWMLKGNTAVPIWILDRSCACHRPHQISATILFQAHLQRRVWRHFHSSLRTLPNSNVSGQGFRTAFDYTNWILISLTAAWTVVGLFFSIFICGGKPANDWISSHTLRTYCIDSFKMRTGFAVSSWFLDIAIFIEPLCMVSNLWNIRVSSPVC